MDVRGGLVPLEQLKPFGRILIRKIGFIAAAWVIIYFGTQWLNAGPAMLFSLIIGGAAGVTIGWYLAQDAVEDAGFSGLSLWVMLILSGWIPIAIVEMILGAIMGWTRGWHLDFGRWMLIIGAGIMIMASAVWRASADD